MKLKIIIRMTLILFLSSLALPISLTYASMLPYGLLWTFTEGNFGGESPPTVADVNNDGNLEIIVGDRRYGYGSFVYCLDRTGNKIWSFSAVGDYGPSGGIYAGVDVWSPDVADIDNDGNLEIVVVSSDRDGLGNNRIIALHSDGTELWRHVTPNHSPTAPRIADINNDGQLEVIGGEGVGAFENGRVYVLDSSGNELWGYNMGRYVNVNVADINNDGNMEVIVGSAYQDNRLYVFDGFGNVLWSQPIASYWTPSIGDINSDGRLEIVVSYSGGVRAFDADGNILWTFDVEPFFGSPAIADLDNDGYAEVIAEAQMYNLYVINGMDGSEIMSYKPGSTIWAAYTNPVVADLDGDGSSEIIVGNIDGYVYCLSSDLTVLWTYFIGDQVIEVAVADINEDGKLEVLAGIDKLYALVEGGPIPPPPTPPVGVPELNFSFPVVTSIIISFYTVIKKRFGKARNL